MEIRIRPNRKQYEFLMDEQHRYLAYGGARGGGKSWAVRQKLRMYGLKYPGIRMLLVRRTYGELQNNHVHQLQDDLQGLARYNKTDKLFTFKNGSLLKLGYFDQDRDQDQYQGAEYDIIVIDEATQLQEDWLRRIIACCRGVNDFPKQIIYTCNPGGPAHAYIKRLFVDRRFIGGEQGPQYAFIPARVYDNKQLMASMPEYVEQLKTLPPKLRKAWLDGSWDVYEGQYFEEFRDNPEGYEDGTWTHVIPPRKVPKSWDMVRSFDWGSRRPFSCGWWAIDHDGILYRVAELYGCQRDTNGESIPNEGLKWTPDEVFREIARQERENPMLAGREIRGVADPAIWDAEYGESIAETAMRHGIYFQKGDHARIPGWMQCHYRLRFDEDGYPGMYVFNTCRDFIRTIPTLQYDEHRPEDLDSEGEDHAADEWRYMCMSRPMAAELIPPAQTGPAWGIDPLNQYSED